MPKVDELPFNLFPGILFLLKNKHMMIEELLQLFVGIIDAELFETVFFEDLKSGNIKNTYEIRIIEPHTSPVELSIDAADQIAKSSFVNALG